jgi:hypothetical protein
LPRHFPYPTELAAPCQGPVAKLEIYAILDIEAAIFTNRGNHWTTTKDIIMKRIHSKILNLCLILLAVIFIATIGYIWLNGIPLRGLPKIDEITSIEISDQRLGIDRSEFTDADDIENAYNAVHLITTMPGSPASLDPVIEISFHLKDKTICRVQADQSTVMINGKSHRIRGDKGTIYIKVIEAMFFFEDLAEPQS